MPQRPIRTLWSVLVLILAPSAAASAEGARPEFNPPDASTWHGWRSAKIRPAFALKDVGYDSNVFLQNEQGNPQGDFTATVSPSAQGLIQFGTRGFLSANVGLDYVWFSRFDDQSHLNAIASMKGNLDLHRIKLFGDGQYQKTDERPSNEIDQRTHRINRTLRGGIAYEHSPVTAIDLILGEERVDYTDEDFLNVYPCIDEPEFPYVGCPVYTLGDLLDRTERSATLRFTHRIGGRTDLVVDASQRRYDFSGPLPDPGLYTTLPVVGPVRNADERRYHAGIELSRGGLLTGSLKAGVTDFRPVYLTEQEIVRGVWDADLAWRLGDRVQIHTVFQRDFYFSIYGSNVYYQQTRKELESVVYLNRFVGAEATYETFNLFFPVVDPALPPLFDEPRIDDIRMIRAGVRFKVKEQSVATLRAGKRTRVSNLPGLDDEQWLVTAGLERTF